MVGRRRIPSTWIAALLIIASVAMASPSAALTAFQDNGGLLTGADLGMPEVAITATDEGWEAPPELEAGRYLVTVSYDGERDFGTTAFAKLPDDWTVDDFNQKLAEVAAQSQPGSTPGAGVSSTDPDISWVYDLTLAGGVSPTPGAIEQGIVDLDAGNWVIWADGFEPAAIPLAVSGDVPAVQSIPETAVTITGASEGDQFRFEIDGTISTERQIVEVVNSSSQPMFIEFVKLSELVTPEQLLAFMTVPAGVAPDPELGVPVDFTYSLTPFYSALQSDGVRQWIITSFEPGAYGMVCWMPDPQHDGQSHASEGMISTFEVS